MKLPANTLHYGDCLDVMRQWPDDCVDLIYLDPPFNSNANYNILFGKRRANNNAKEISKRKDLAQLVAFEDMWEWSEKTARRVEEIRKATAHPARDAVLALNAFYKNGSGMLTYLVYMADRIAEMRRIMKPTGSIYLHCDPTASHYLKVVMDAVFGAKNFRNEIVWKRKQEKHNLAKKRMGAAHDILFYYVASTETAYNRQFTGYDPAYIAAHYKHEDKRGLYATFPCTNEKGGNKPYEFRGITRAWRFEKSRMQQMFKDGLLTQATPTSPFRYKKYLDEADGVPVDDLWADIPAVRGNEDLGYPTQKPFALLERVLETSSNRGDIVLDPFCGCGTTIEAAMNLKRKFIGIDISMYALNVIQKQRLKDTKFKIGGIPADLQSARAMAADNPFAFEKWAVHLIPGFVANNKQRGDGGVDGWGCLLHAPPGEEGICMAQVKSGAPSADALRAFTSRLAGGAASLGVFITMEKCDTPTARRCVAEAGALTLGANAYDRMLLWSIEEYFAGVMPKLPPLANPVTGQAIQEDIMTRDR